MPQRDVSITTPDGALGASLHTPDGAGPWPAVIMYPDAGGVRPTFQDMAQRLADLGYAVLLPDPYYRLGEIAPFDMKNVFNDEAERNRLMKLVGSVTKAERHDGHRGRARLARRAARGVVGQGRHDRLLHGRRDGAQRRRPLPRPGRRGGVVPRRPDRQHRARQPAPAGRRDAGQGVRGRGREGRLVRRRAVRAAAEGADRGRRRPHAGDVPGAARVRRPRQPDLRRGRGDPPLGGARGAVRLGAAPA